MYHILIMALAAVGTKPQLVNNLLLAAKGAIQKPPFSVVSVDMGIRNLSICHFLVHNSFQETKVSYWTRLDIEEEFRPSSWPDSISSFDPDRLARITYDLVQAKCFNTETKKLPDAILIERQRFRSASSTAILEWTVRVNMLENMLHAVLYAKAQQQKKGISTGIFSISPKRVLSFWKEQVSRNKVQISNSNNAKGKSYRETKDFKTQIAASLILNSTSITFDSHSLDTREHLLSGKGKNDDLADSFLQGEAWIQWQQNRLALNNILATQNTFVDPKNFSKELLCTFGIS